MNVPQNCGTSHCSCIECVLEDDGEGADCPVCRSDLMLQIVQQRSSEDVRWVQLRMHCPECGYKGETWDEVD